MTHFLKSSSTQGGEFEELYGLVSNLLVDRQREVDKRTHSEQQSSEARRTLILEILDLNDALERALKDAPSSTAQGGQEVLISNIQMLHRRFGRLLKLLKISEIPALGKIADPYLHNVLDIEYDPALPFGSIVRVIQKGYFIDDQILRVAVVIAAGNKIGEK